MLKIEQVMTVNIYPAYGYKHFPLSPVESEILRFVIYIVNVNSDYREYVKLIEN